MPQPNWKTGTALAAVAALGLTGAGLLNQPSEPTIEDAIHLTDDVDRDFLTGTEAELRRGTATTTPPGDAAQADTLVADPAGGSAGATDDGADAAVPAPPAPGGGVTAASAGSGALDASTAQAESPQSPDSPDSVASPPSPASPDSVESPDSPQSPASPDSLDT